MKGGAEVAGLGLAMLAGLAGQCWGTGQAPPVFEGRIQAALTRGGETQVWVYTVTTDAMRIERGETDQPHACNLVNLHTGERTLIFPHNRSFVRLKPEAVTTGRLTPGIPPMPSTPPGVGSSPQLPAGIGPTNLLGLPASPPMPSPPPMPALPATPAHPAGLPPGIGPQPGAAPGAVAGMAPMPMMAVPVEPLELKATGATTNLLGHPCARYELKQGLEVMEIWATDRLVAFESWLANQRPRFGPQRLEEQWAEVLKARKLFPLRAVLRMETPSLPGATPPPAAGVERMRFEVKSITPEKIEDRGGTLFRPPADYHEVRPLPF